MPDPTEHIPDPTTPSFLKRWLGWRSLALTVLVLILLSPVLYRGRRLAQVPATDEPFDIEEFLTEIPDEKNAYIGFEQAGRELIDVPHRDYSQYNDELDTGWDFDTAVLDRHLDNNRMALNTWLKGTQKDHYQPSSDWSSTESPIIAVKPTREFNRLSRTQIQKMVRTNHPAKAMPWVKALLRFAHLVRQWGDGLNYSVGVAVFSNASRNVNDWAVHPDLSRSEIDRVRETLEDARCLNPSPSEFVIAAYIADRSFHEQLADTLIDDAFSEGSVSTDGRAWLEAEPEYTMRLFTHIVRNHLLFIETDRRERPPLINGNLFEDATASPTQRGNLPASQLMELIRGSYLLYDPNLSGGLAMIDRDEAKYRCLTVALAAQAYFRDRGVFPVDAKALVPDYLDEIPDDLFSPAPAPLLYRRDGDGAVVYSRFTNELDDGGTVIDYNENRSGGDLLDYGFRIRNPFNRPLAAPKP